MDEHYIATVLAVEGLDDQTDCHGGLQSTDFTVKNSTHPIEYKPEAISSTLRFTRLLGFTVVVISASRTCRPIARNGRCKPD